MGCQLAFAAGFTGKMKSNYFDSQLWICWIISSTSLCKTGECRNLSICWMVSLVYFMVTIKSFCYCILFLACLLLSLIFFSCYFMVNFWVSCAYYLAVHLAHYALDFSLSFGFAYIMYPFTGPVSNISWMGSCVMKSFSSVLSSTFYCLQSCSCCYLSTKVCQDIYWFME